jgi:ATP-binding protein involved in chromosome partitioning
MSATVTEAAVLHALRGVHDPDRGEDIVTVGLVKDLHVHDGDVTFTLAFAGQSPAAKASLHSSATKVVSQIPGVGKVQVKMGSAAAAKAAAGHGAPPPAADLIPEVKHTVAVSSGKGGVGKSTVAVNLALALKQGGAEVGLVDLDVYGPDVPIMMGTKARPNMFDNKIVPIEAHGIKIMSIGLLVAEREALVWRGPMIHSAVQQFLRDVWWGPLDYLVFDMPPGTGDAQLSLSQVVPLGGVVMVTTPQDVALLDVGRGIAMFTQVSTPVLGIVENMAGYQCPACGTVDLVFGEGGGARLAEHFGVPLLARVPLVTAVREAGDRGTPLVAAAPGDPTAVLFRDLAERVAAAAQRQQPPAVAQAAP